MELIKEITRMSKSISTESDKSDKTDDENNKTLQDTLFVTENNLKGAKYYNSVKNSQDSIFTGKKSSV